MKVLIHDLGITNKINFEKAFDYVINADGKYAPCQGCFNCWTKHPAECYMKDSLKEVCRVIGRADELTIITENCYGAYSPEVKNILDRSNGTSTPFSTYRGGQMHHTLRYGKHQLFKVYTYGSITPDEKATFEYMAERNAINYGYKQSEVIVLESLSELEEMFK